jgi:hypothetical protein
MASIAGLASTQSEAPTQPAPEDTRPRISMRIELAIRDDDSQADRAQLGEAVAALLRGKLARQQYPDPSGLGVVLPAAGKHIREMAEVAGASSLRRAEGLREAADYLATLLPGIGESSPADGQEGG